MLVLGRGPGEVIIVGDGLIRITVTEIRHGKVKLGFECDPSISVHRLEVFERIKQEGKAATEL